MPQFFISSSSVRGGRCRIQGEDFRHLVTVRRAGPGDIVRLRDEKGAALTARIEEITDTHIELAIQNGGGEETSSGYPELILCACILKGKNFDLVIEKAVEIGVSRIIPVASERTITRPADEAARLVRWNRKACEAAKQSLRERVPAVEKIHHLRDVVEGFTSGTRIIAHPGAGISLKEFLAVRRAGPVHLLVGPEGGFSGDEIEDARAAGWAPVSVGRTHMRAETAALVLCGIIMFELGDITTPGRQ